SVVPVHDRGGRTRGRRHGRGDAAARSYTRRPRRVTRRRWSWRPVARRTVTAAAPHGRSGRRVGVRGLSTDPRCESRSWGRSGPGCPESRTSSPPRLGLHVKTDQVAGQLVGVAGHVLYLVPAQVQRLPGAGCPVAVRGDQVQVSADLV